MIDFIITYYNTYFQYKCVLHTVCSFPDIVTVMPSVICLHVLTMLT